jgi:hypothetical protein
MAFVCEKSLKRTYAEKIGEFLGITGENDIQRSSRAQFYKRKDRDKMRKQSDAYQNRCKIRKIVTATRVAKESAKDTSYKPGKVPLTSIGRRRIATNLRNHESVESVVYMVTSVQHASSQAVDATRKHHQQVHPKELAMVMQAHQHGLISCTNTINYRRLHIHSRSTN